MALINLPKPALPANSTAPNIQGTEEDGLTMVNGKAQTSASPLIGGKPDAGLTRTKEAETGALPPSTPASALAMGLPPGSAAQAGGDAQTKRVRSDQTADITREKDQARQTQDLQYSADAQEQADREQRRTLTDQITSLGSLENQLPALALKKLNDDAAAKKPLETVSVSPDSELAKQNPEYKKALVEGRSVTVNTKTGAVTIGEPGSAPVAPGLASDDVTQASTDANANTAFVASLGSTGTQYNQNADKPMSDADLQAAISAGKKVTFDSTTGKFNISAAGAIPVDPKNPNLAADIAHKANQDAADYAAKAAQGNSVQTTAAAAIIQAGADPKGIADSFDKLRDVAKPVTEITPSADQVHWATSLASADQQAALHAAGGDIAKTHAQLQDVIRNAQNQFMDVEQAQGILQNAAADNVSRAAAQRYLQTQGLTGRLAPAQKLNNIVAQLADNDTVKIGSKTMTVDEMMNDDHMTTLIGEALDDPSMLQSIINDPSTKDFGLYIQNNAKAWDNIVKPIKDQLGGVNAIRGAMTKQASYGDGSPIDPGVMDKLMPGWNDLKQVGSLDQPPLLKALATLTDPNQIKAVKNILAGAAGDPQLWERIKGMDLKAIQDSGMLDGKHTYTDLTTSAAARAKTLETIQGKPLSEQTRLLAPTASAKWTKQAAQVQDALSQLGITPGTDLNKVDTSHMDAATQEAFEHLKVLSQTYDFTAPGGGALSQAKINEITDVSPDGFWKGADPAGLDTSSIDNAMDDAVNYASTIAANAKTQADLKASALKVDAGKTEELRAQEAAKEQTTIKAINASPERQRHPVNMGASSMTSWAGTPAGSAVASRIYKQLNPAGTETNPTAQMQQIMSTPAGQQQIAAATSKLPRELNAKAYLDALQKADPQRKELLQLALRNHFDAPISTAQFNANGRPTDPILNEFLELAPEPGNVGFDKASGKDPKYQDIFAKSRQPSPAQVAGNAFSNQEAL